MNVECCGSLPSLWRRHGFKRIGHLLIVVIVTIVVVVVAGRE